MEKFRLPLPKKDNQTVPIGWPVLFTINGAEKVIGQVNSVLPDKFLLVQANNNLEPEILQDLGFASGQRLIAPAEYEVVPPNGKGISLNRESLP